MSEEWRVCYDCDVPNRLEVWDEYNNRCPGMQGTRRCCPECASDHFRHHDVDADRALEYLREAIAYNREYLARLEQRERDWPTTAPASPAAP